MADFIIRVLKWLAALVTAYFILFVLFFAFLIVLSVAFQPVAKSVEKDSVLVMDLAMNLSDKPSSGDPFSILASALSGKLKQGVSLRQVLNALNEARYDEKINGLLIKGNLIAEGYGGSLATLKEVRQAIAAFAKDKPVWSFVKGDSLRDYYLKSAATEVYSDPYAIVDFRGLRAERIYWGDAMEKIGVEFQISAYEEYKTAMESFVSGEMSEPERLQMTSLINDIWEDIIGDIALSRSVSPADLDSVAARDMLIYAEDVTEGKLSDQSINMDELDQKLANLVGYGKNGESFRQFDFVDYVQRNMVGPAALKVDMGGNKVAILYIEGIIVDGKGDDGFVGGEKVSRQMREIRDDSSIKALVIRVNSPGGSASASNRIAREIELTRKKMPVVISMGGVGASGGYMIAAAGDYIFIEPTSITGSIGVVSMLPNVQKLAEKLSLNFEVVETHPFAGSFSISRSKTEEEMRQLRALGAQTYDEFIQLVATHRKMTVEEVREVAKGRVWSGLAALENNLADEQGGLINAVRRAADMAGIGDDYKVIDRPKVLTLEEQIEEMLVESRIDQFKASVGLESFADDVGQQLRQLKAFNDPHGQYLILPYSLKLY